MDHNEAITIQATEKYLLDELAPETREQFEEHLFGCNQCALDVRTAAMFVEQSKIVLNAPQPARAPAGEASRGWMAWLRPAISVPVMAGLLAVIGYQAANQSPSLASGPQLVSSLSLVTANARGESAQAFTLPAGKPLVVFVDVPPAAQVVSYAADFRNSSGAVLWTLPISAQAAKDTLTLEIPAVSGSAGPYSLVIRALDASGQSSEVAHYAFSAESR
jgi:hypothetical protein